MVKRAGVETLFLQEKPAKCLLLLKGAEEPTYASIIAREINTTYAHTLKVLSRLKRFGLIDFKRAGRIKLVELTELGEGTAARLEALIQMAKLSELGARIERIYERRIRGRGLDRKAISKRMRPYRRELKRMVRKSPELKPNARKLMRRIREIVREGVKPQKT